MPARPFASRLFRRSAAVATLGLLALVGAEVLLRSFPQYLPAAAHFRLHDRAIARNPFKSVPHDRAGYLWQPQIHDRFEGFDFHFDYSTDSHGFRNPGPWPARADVVVVGDSEAFGFGVGDGEDWVRRMAARLPGAAVINLGLIGAAPQQLPEIYRAYGRPLHPKVVLVALFLPNAVTMGRLFAEWHAAGRPERFDTRRERGRPPAASNGVLGRVRDRLHGSYAVLGLYHGLRSALGLSSLRTISFADGARVRLVADRYGGPAASAAANAADFTRVIDTLERLDRAIKADGAEMIVVPFPTKEEVYLPLLDERPNQLVAPFRRALEERGIAAFDLTPALRQAATGEDLFFEIDLHPNPAGQALIGRAVSDQLQRRFGERGLGIPPKQ